MAYKGDQHLGDLFRSRREKGIAGLPKLSVTMNDGLVDRESLDRKMETNLADEDHLLVRKGDIAYNMMRMWQGASGLAEKDGLVSPAYVVLEPKPKIDSLYASYLFKSQRMIHLFWAYSYGLTSDRLRLYYDDFAAIPTLVPSRKEQAAIAAIFLTWDSAIRTTEALARNAKMQKVALLTRVLHGDKTWKSVRIRDLAKLNPKNESLPADARVSFVPMDAVSDEGQLIRLDEASYSDVTSGHPSFKNNDVLVAKITPCFENGKGAFVSALISPIGFGSTEFVVIRAGDKLSAKFIYHVTCSSEFRKRGELNMQGSAGQKRVPTDYLRRYTFFIPRTQEEQSRVVDALDRNDALLQLLKQDLRLLKTQKKSLMQQLFTGKPRVKLLPRHENADA